MLWNKKQQKKEAEFRKRVTEFQKELKELCEKHGINIRPIMLKYGLNLEFFDINKK